MEPYAKDAWIQAFCLHLAMADSQAYDGALLKIARECWEHSKDLEPADAVQSLLLDRVLHERRRRPAR